MWEEAPASYLDPATRETLCSSAVQVARAVSYRGAGTLEFLYDETTGEFFFIEMNTRIQVEHPVTEMVTDVDLVKSQISIAAGESLDNVLHGPILHRGHAIECRINAEHPEKFTPSAGRITAFNVPGGNGVRVDSGVYGGWRVPSDYDSLLAKLIVHAPTRREAIVRMRRALDELIVVPIHYVLVARLARSLRRRARPATRRRAGMAGESSIHLMVRSAAAPLRRVSNHEARVCAALAFDTLATLAPQAEGDK